MYSFLLKLNLQHPRLIIHFAYAPNTTVLREVTEGLLDVGFVTKPTDDPALAAEPIDQEKLCIIVPSDHGDRSFRGLIRRGFINHPDGYHHAGRLLAKNYPAEFAGMESIPITGFSNQIARIPEPVALGLGFTALPEYACRAFPEQARLRYSAPPPTGPRHCLYGVPPSRFPAAALSHAL